jgi:DNA-binding FrmR family transcriptional regulator
MIGRAVIVEAMPGGLRIDAHATDGIARDLVGIKLGGVGAVVAMAGMASVPSSVSMRVCGFTHPALQPLEVYTLGGYIESMRKDIKSSVQKRLGRIEGQVRGLSRMVDEDRYCIDIVTQISAVRAALRRVEEEVLRDHVAHCVEHAITSGNKADQREKIAELMDVIGRSDR